MRFQHESQEHRLEGPTTVIKRHVPGSSGRFRLERAFLETGLSGPSLRRRLGGRNCRELDTVTSNIARAQRTLFSDEGSTRTFEGDAVEGDVARLLCGTWSCGVTYGRLASPRRWGVSWANIGSRRGFEVRIHVGVAARLVCRCRSGLLIRIVLPLVDRT